MRNVAPISDVTSGRAWYQPPRSIDIPVGYHALLAQARETLVQAALHRPCVLASSLSAEDMVLLHLIVNECLPIASFALDTGRLPVATQALWKQVEVHYGITIERVIPGASRLRDLTQTQYDSAIYETKTARERCCTVRKTEPLRNTLMSKAAWVTGLRRAQSVDRANVPLQVWDASFKLHKFNPLANWSDEALWYFVSQENVPVNSLYAQGYASIGCDPCTRPIRFDEHPRAGRWWWEQSGSSECGIHIAEASITSAQINNGK